MYIKPTANAIPLSGSSIHHNAVHRGWPQAQITRIRNRFNNAKAAQTAIDSYKVKLEDSGCHVPTQMTSVARSRLQPKSSWLVIPYRPMYAGLQKGVMSLNAEAKCFFAGLTFHRQLDAIRRVFGEGDLLGLPWSAGDPSVSKRIAKALKLISPTPNDFPLLNE